MNTTPRFMGGLVGLLMLACLIGCGDKQQAKNSPEKNTPEQKLPETKKATEVPTEPSESTSTSNDNVSEDPEETDSQPKGTNTVKVASYQFEAPIRLKAGDEFVSVESPGYACPTMADVDGDGVEDLVVGQFSNGNMLFCKNEATADATPEFAKAEWLSEGDDRIVVPGVW